MTNYEWIEELSEYLNKGLSKKFWDDIVNLYERYGDMLNMRLFKDATTDTIECNEYIGQVSIIFNRNNGSIVLSDATRSYQVIPKNDTILVIELNTDEKRKYSTQFEALFRNMVDPRRTTVKDFTLLSEAGIQW